MHHPLYKAHPLCQPEIEQLVRCHTDRPIAKFFGVCNDAKHWLDVCFKEEKVLRKQYNPRVSGKEWLKGMPMETGPQPPQQPGAARSGKE